MGLENFKHVGASSNGDKFSNGKEPESDEDLMDTDDEDVDETLSAASVQELGEDFLQNSFKKASVWFFNKYGLISHQIDSYNDFISYGIQRAFDSVGEINVSPGFDPSKKGENDWRYASVRFGKVTLEPPSFVPGEKATEELKLLPRHARLQNMTYSCRMKVEICIEIYTQKLVRGDKFKTGKEQYHNKEIVHEEKKDVFIGRMPVMVNSDICWMSQEVKGDCEFDKGGYFIIKGAEKTFISQEQVSLKRLWVANKPNWSIAYRSDMKKKRVFIKLVGDSKVENITCEKVLSVYFMSSEMPVWLLFFALGVSSDKEVVDLIDFDTDDTRITNILSASIYDANDKYADFRNEGNSFKYVEKLFQGCAYPPSPEESTEDCINRYLFPSLSSFKKKATFLGYMIKCLLQAYIGQRDCDNRDNFRNKRLDLAGDLLERELRVHIKHAERRMVKAMQRDLYGDRPIRQIENYLDASIITNGLSRAFSTGAWSHPYKRMERLSGVVATLGRANPLQTIADMRRTRQQVQYAGKVGDARYPHPSHWGKICFLSTPDGENCGLVKNLAVTGLVSTEVKKPLLGKLYACGMKRLIDETSELLCGKHKVFLNGEWVGVCEDSTSLVTALKNKRRRGHLPHQVEIKRDEKKKEVRIFSDAGRILRPLAVVNNLRKLKTFKEVGKEDEKEDTDPFTLLLARGVIELVGAEEEEDCQIAFRVSELFADGKANSRARHTHCELDLSFLLGLSCGIIPFVNHDHARRALYQSQKHSQQAIGYSSSNPDIRVDTLSHQMYYPQRPLFHTIISDCLGRPGSLGPNKVLPREELYNGQNAIVAVNVHLGYNQEDSLVMNRASLERGMFRTEHIRSYKAEVENRELLEKKKKNDDAVNFGKIQSKIGRVDSLDDDGFPYIGANLQNGDIVIGRCTESGADHSIKLKHTERGMVQKVVLSANDEGKNFAVVSLRQVRSPCLGDKFSSMHGQKGVLGYLESQENFPFTKQGIVPDIVINPHAFPSRQTPGQLLEAALGKGIACGGQLKYATPFSTLSVDAIIDQLHSAGFMKWGNERVYNGRTGEMVSTMIFMGPTFYQRLIHMSEDKVKFRNTGPVHPLTRQPVTDRKRFGGIKFGEMERDCLIAHGAAANLHERLFTLSDSSQMHICTKCKKMANVIQRTVPGGRKIRGPYCRICESTEDIVKANVPYGAKLLCQELFSMGISLKFETQLC